MEDVSDLLDSPIRVSHEEDMSRYSLIREVVLSPEVLEVCWAHALSNEKEEVMGLLVGYVEDRSVCFLTLKILKRLTKEKDRVEIAAEQLLAGAKFAEDLTEGLGKQLRVLGWYHSHPHITVLPSAVDLRTQASYQLMDDHFVGLIFSAFSTDRRTGEETRKVAAFQSVDDIYGTKECRDVEISVRPRLSHVSEQVFCSVYNSLGEMWMILAQEETEEFNKYKATGPVDTVAEINNQAQLASRLAQIHRRIVLPVIQTMAVKLQVAKREKGSRANKLGEDTTEQSSARFNKSMINVEPNTMKVKSRLNKSMQAASDRKGSTSHTMEFDRSEIHGSTRNQGAESQGEIGGKRYSDSQEF